MSGHNHPPASGNTAPDYDTQELALVGIQADHEARLEASGLLDRARTLMGNIPPSFDGKSHVRVMVSEEHIERNPARCPEVVFGLTVDKDEGSFTLPLRIKVGLINSVDEAFPYHGFIEADVTQVQGMLDELEAAKQAGQIPDVTKDYLFIDRPPEVA